VTDGPVPLRDLHSHVIPGVDDGAGSLASGLAALRAFRAAGVSALITTPHLRGSLTLDPPALEARLREVDLAWTDLRSAAREAGLDLDLRRGFEVMMDDPHLDLSDPRVRMDGGRFVLLEWPGLQVPPETGPVIQRIREQGWVPLIAHPERYWGLDRGLAVVGRWREAGARLQVNHGSLLGRYGDGARTVALRLLRRGWADLLSSDYHPRPGRSPDVRAVAAVFAEMGAQEQWEMLASVNPGRILEGRDPVPVPPLGEGPGLWDRVRGVIRKGVG
jgi:protein-tyrosine phosphatase